MAKVCARLVPQMLSDTPKKIRKAKSTDLLRHTTMEARASCCRLSLVTKPSSTILNLTLVAIAGMTPHDIPKDKETQQYAISWKNKSYNLLR
jgi:hypothetical protein